MESKTWYVNVNNTVCSFFHCFITWMWGHLQPTKLLSPFRKSLASGKKGAAQPLSWALAMLRGAFSSRSPKRRELKLHWRRRPKDDNKKSLPQRQNTKPNVCKNEILYTWLMMLTLVAQKFGGKKQHLGRPLYPTYLATFLTSPGVSKDTQVYNFGRNPPLLNHYRTLAGLIPALIMRCTDPILKRIRHCCIQAALHYTLD